MPASTTTTHLNRLAREKSPYLLQHAHNPVDWFPWGDEAFEKARAEDKPVFLSIGYSTCHWCHVMERESFEDEEVAALMNDAFVSVKVDREERPDIDGIYMTLCKVMTGSGGWPLTIIMTPECKPFFATTYIPRESRHGQPGVKELVPRIKELWRTRRGEILESAEKVIAALPTDAGSSEAAEIGVETLARAFNDLTDWFDESHGGFGDAPKFPSPHVLSFLLKYWKRTANHTALDMVLKTLREMRAGGIYDQVGFGFHRYSTDARWFVPHFEKMLCDQALHAVAYLDAYQATREPELARTAEEIFTYVLRDMTDRGGGFYTAEDADSEGVEGLFYLWTEDDIRKVLPPVDTDFAIRLFGIERDGNYIDETSRRSTGMNILYVPRAASFVAEEFGFAADQLHRRTEPIREKLFEAREQRVHPHKDDKILTDWNGLMIAALARGAQVLENPVFASSAPRAADFILSTLRNPRGGLLHTYRKGEASVSGFLDDYAFSIWGLIELYEATFEVRWLRTALELNAVLLDHFRDKARGGFFETPDDGERLLARPKETYDGAIPSGNSIEMMNLLRLARMTGDSQLEEVAAQMSRSFSREAAHNPAAHSHMLSAVDYAIGPSYEVVIAGNIMREDTRKMLRALRASYHPNIVVLFAQPRRSLPRFRT